jgi:hypothetical protein
VKKFLKITLMATLQIGSVCANACAVEVLDNLSQQTLSDAIVTHLAKEYRTDESGKFEFAGPCDSVSVRAIGYQRPEQPSHRQEDRLIFRLNPFRPKAIYLSYWGIRSKELREKALEIARDTEVNAFVIDIKSDRGELPHRSQVAMVNHVGAQKNHVVSDMKSLVSTLKGRGLYLIARIVVFKDDLLVQAMPHWAVRDDQGKVYRDREEQAWVDPSQQDAWSYALDIASEAAEMGFDEIQFDYVRFPDAQGLKFSIADNEQNRESAIVGFLSQARARLAPFNVFLAADVFGYVAWNHNDTHIGQRLETLVNVLDYVCPMLYPSGFQYGIPGYTNPVEHPYEIVHLSLERAAQRTGASALHFRPWLQAFRDYAFDKRDFEGNEIRKQIEAAEQFGSGGWMLWNPRNVYSGEGLAKSKALDTPGK